MKRRYDGEKHLGGNPSHRDMGFAFHCLCFPGVQERIFGHGVLVTDSPGGKDPQKS